MQRNTAVFLTYNSVGRELSNGWHKHGSNHALLLQGFIRKERSGPDIEQKRLMLISLFCQLQQSVDLRTMKYLVVNCGKLPNQAIILSGMLVQPEKIILVHCGCGGPILNFPEDPMHQAAFIRTGCGGISTMQRIFKHFRQKGELPVFATLGEVLKDPGK